MPTLAAEAGLGKEPLIVNKAEMGQASGQGLRERGRGPGPREGGACSSEAPKE